MISYATVEKLESSIAVLELRLTSKDDSYENTINDEKNRNYDTRYITKMVEIPIKMITEAFPNIKENDVLVVEHNSGIIQRICYLDFQEKERRIARNRSSMQRLKQKMHKE